MSKGGHFCLYWKRREYGNIPCLFFVFVLVFKELRKFPERKPDSSTLSEKENGHPWGTRLLSRGSDDSRQNGPSSYLYIQYSTLFPSCKVSLSPLADIVVGRECRYYSVASRDIVLFERHIGGITGSKNT